MKLRSLSVLFLTLICFAMPSFSLAMPANPTDTLLVQPDGTSFKARAQGDEWNNHLETEDGFTIEADIDGTWRHVLRFEGNTAVLAPTRAEEEPLSGLQQSISKDPRPVPQEAIGVLRTPDSPESPEMELDGPNAGPVGNFNGHILFILAEFSNQSGINGGSYWGSASIPPIIDYYNKASYGKVNLIPAN